MVDACITMAADAADDDDNVSYDVIACSSLYINCHDYSGVNVDGKSSDGKFYVNDSDSEFNPIAKTK